MLATRVALGGIALACFVLTIVYGVSSGWWLGASLACVGLAFLNLVERKRQSS